MAKLQFKLQEDENKEELVTDEVIEELIDETPVVEDVETTEEGSESIFTEPTSDKLDFIDSEELNEIREILLDIPDDIMLLLLNDNAIILATEEGNTTMAYTLEDESNELTLIELSKSIADVLSNENIIKYTPDRVDPRHDKVVELLMNKLEVDQPKEEVEETEPEIKEPKEEEENKDE